MHAAKVLQPFLPLLPLDHGPPASVAHAMCRKVRPESGMGQAHHHQERAERRVGLSTLVGGCHHKGHPDWGDVVHAYRKLLCDCKVIDLLKKVPLCNGAAHSSHGCHGGRSGCGRRSRSRGRSCGRRGGRGTGSR
eukprot:3098706-Pyramimonas_sp.AAC.1